MCDITCKQPIMSLGQRLKDLLKVRRLKNMMNLNAFTMKKVLVHERGQIKEIILLYQCSHK